MARLGLNAASLLVAVVGLAGCPGDDVTTPMSTEGSSSTSGATETSNGVTTSPGTSTGQATTTIGQTTVDTTGTTVADTTAGDTTVGETTRGDTTVGDTTIADTTSGESTEGLTTSGDTTTTFGDTTSFGETGGFDCGNDMIDGFETCDGADLGGETCESLGFESGTLSCMPGCFSFDTSMCQGEGGCCSANGTPGCADMACTAAVCADDPFCCDTEWDDICASSAPLYAECQGVSNCPECGNDLLEAGEVCEANNLDGETCETLGFESGMLGCEANCQGFDISGCVAGGACCTPNGTVGCEAGACMDAICAFDPFCCNVEWDGACANAALTQPECQGASDCPNCGNAMLEGIEACDGDNLGGQTCESLGYASGSLACDANCLSFDETSCQAEGACCAPNGTIGCEDMGCTNAVCELVPECCDEPWSQTCADVAALVPECQALPGCPDCGNGELDGPEVCDGDNLDGQTCATLGLNTGVLACATTCVEFDVSGCFSGSCCAPNDTPNCEDEGCTAAICAADPYCCNVEWDGICADSAGFEPACAGVGGCPP